MTRAARDQWAARSASGQVSATAATARAPAKLADLAPGPRDGCVARPRQSGVPDDHQAGERCQYEPGDEVGLPCVGAGGHPHGQVPAFGVLD